MNSNYLLINFNVKLVEKNVLALRNANTWT